MMRMVGVIGSGAAGLCAARHILSTTSHIPVVWDQASKVGGTWVYTSHTGKDQHGLPIHSSMYENMKTNLPKEVMGFPDFPFPTENDDSFIHHTEVLKYLQSYADHFNLQPCIKLRHHVELVKPVSTDAGFSWAVTVQDLDTKTSSTTTCDALFICNGHYSVPNVPQVKEIERYRGKQTHSHDYREPSPYQGKTIVVLGAAASGLDITLELSTVAKEVILSHNLPVQIPSELPPNVRQARGVVSALDDGFVFADGSSAQADVILFCTGYKFTFPFLSDDCGITVENNIVKPLYKHIINTTHPSMGFIGIPFQVCPFPLFDFQVQFFLKVLLGEVTLPSKMDMDENIERDLSEKCSAGMALRHYHKIGSQQWHYNDHLADLAGLPYLSRAVRYFLGTLMGVVSVKSQQEMLATTQSELQYRRSLGYRDKHFHLLGFSRQECYLADLAKGMEAAPIQQHILTLFKISLFRLVFSLLKAKKYKYTTRGDSVIETLDGEEINTKWDLGILIVQRLACLIWHDFPGTCTAAFNFLWLTLKRAFTW